MLIFPQSTFSVLSLVRAILTVWSMSLLQFSVTVMAAETRAKDIEELKEQLLKEEALKKQERDLKVKRNQVRGCTDCTIHFSESINSLNSKARLDWLNSTSFCWIG